MKRYNVGLEAFPKKKWSLTHDKCGCRYDHMTTNLSDAVNQIFKGAWNMPITTLVKVTHDRLVNYFVKRGAQDRAKYCANNIIARSC